MRIYLLLFNFIFLFTTPILAEEKLRAEEVSISRIDNLNLYVQVNQKGEPKLLFSYELPSSQESANKNMSDPIEGLSELFDFDGTQFGSYSDIYKVSLSKNGDLKITSSGEVIGIPYLALKNPSPIDIDYPTRLLSGPSPENLDLKVIDRFKKDGTDYILLRVKYIGSGSNAVCGAAPDESIRLIKIKSETDKKISSGFPYFSCYGLSDGGVLVYSRHEYYILSDYRNIMVFNKQHPEWGFLIRKI